MESRKPQRQHQNRMISQPCWLNYISSQLDLSSSIAIFGANYYLYAEEKIFQGYTQVPLLRYYETKRSFRETDVTIIFCDNRNVREHPDGRWERIRLIAKGKSNFGLDWGSDIGVGDLAGGGTKWSRNSGNWMAFVIINPRWGSLILEQFFCLIVDPKRWPLITGAPVMLDCSYSRSVWWSCAMLRWNELPIVSRISSHLVLSLVFCFFFFLLFFFFVLSFLFSFFVWYGCFLFLPWQSLSNCL